jgi:NiFe hydrogenase small subunit HydA
MIITRRGFLKYCAASAAALELSVSDLFQLESALAAESMPTVLWLHGSGCQGDSISLLNLYADIDPVGSVTAGDILLDHLDLAYHTVLMSGAGQTAVQMAQEAQAKGGYLLVLEGGVPTAFGGRACLVYSQDGQAVTYQQAVEELVGSAWAVMSVGTCACFGGIVASGPDPFEHNPTDVISATSYVQQIDPNKFVMNIPGCPAHPAWTTWGLVQLILGRQPALDGDLRPVALFGNKQQDAETMNIHENCPRNPNRPGSPGLAERLGEDYKCLENLGCRGPSTYSDCPSRKWHNGETGPVNWCVDCNGLCLGCVESDFPGGPFYT